MTKLPLLFLLTLFISCEDGPKQNIQSFVMPEASAGSELIASPESELIASPESELIASPETEIELKRIQFMKLVNDHRHDQGLSDLVHDEGLGKIAREHSKDMAADVVDFGHSGFSGRCSAGRKALAGANLCAENVAKGQKTVEAALKAWLNSPGHRANLEQRRHTHTGFGFKQDSKGVYYWTQLFMEKN